MYWNWPVVVVKLWSENPGHPNKALSPLLKVSPPEYLIENFNVALTQYTAALHCIVPVFIYMVTCKYSLFLDSILSDHLNPLLMHLPLNITLLKNKFYIETKLNRDLRDDLMKLFSDHVAEKHVSVLLRECLSQQLFILLDSDFL